MKIYTIVQSLTENYTSLKGQCHKKSMAFTGIIWGVLGAQTMDRKRILLRHACQMPSMAELFFLVVKSLGYYV